MGNPFAETLEDPRRIKVYESLTTKTVRFAPSHAADAQGAAFNPMRRQSLVVFLEKWLNFGSWKSLNGPIEGKL
jgi:hypothetical protein